MSTPAHENAASLLRKQQRTTARLRVGLPALLAHLEHTEVLAPEGTAFDPFEPFEPVAPEASSPGPGDGHPRSDPGSSSIP